MPAQNITNNLYDLTNSTSSGSVLGFVQVVNDMTAGYFMLGVLIAGWIVLYVSMSDFGNKEALASSSFIISVMALLFSAMDLLAVKWLMIIFIIAAAILTPILMRRDP